MRRRTGILDWTLLVLLVSANPMVICGQVKKSDPPNLPAGVAARGQLSPDRSYEYDFVGISVPTLQSWLAGIGVELPVALDGELSGWVWVQRSEKSWFDFAGYRIEGEIRSPDLGIEQWSFAEANVRFGFSGGNWYVGKLAGELRAPNDRARIGIVRADARVLTATTREIAVNAKIDRVDIKPLLQSLGIELDIDNSGGALSLKGTVPIRSVSNLTKWIASSNIEINDVVLPWFKAPGKAFASLKLSDGQWKVAEGQVNVADQLVTVSGTGRLDQEFPFELSAAGRDIDISQLARQLKNDELAGQVDGIVRINAKATGNLSAGIQSVNAATAASRLQFQNQTIEQLELKASYTPAKIQLDIASALLANGGVRGSVTWRDIARLASGVPSDAKLRIEQVELKELAWFQNPVQVEGRATGDFEFVTIARDEMDDWTSTGRLKIDDLRFGGTQMGAADFEWSKKQIDDRLTGSAIIQRAEGWLRSNFVVNLQSVPNVTMRACQFSDYRADGQLENYDLNVQYGANQTESIPVRVIGRFELSGSADQWLQRGTANLSNSVAMLGARTLRLQMAEVSFNEAEFRIQRFRLLDQGGRIAGSLALRRNQQGQHCLRLRMVDFELSPWLQRFGSNQFDSLNGLAMVDLELARPAAAEDLWKDWNGSWQCCLREMKFKEEALGELELNGKIVDQNLSATAKGQLLGGVAAAALELPVCCLKNENHVDPQPASLQIQISKLQARRLARLFFDRRFSDAITGNGSLVLTAEGTSANNLVAEATVEVPLISHKRKTLTQDLTAKLRYADNSLFVERLAGGFAGGRIETAGQLRFESAPFSIGSGSRLAIVAQRLDAERLIGFFYPDYVDGNSGVISYRGTATFDPRLEIVGSASITDGMLLGIPIQSARCELRTKWDKAGRFQKLVTRDLHGKGIGGKFEAALLIQGDKQFTLQTDGKVTGGKLDQLSRALGFQQIVGSGTFDGRFLLESRQLGSMDAMTGDLQIDFENGDVKSIPILSSLDRFVPLAQFASTNIENGRLNAKIGQGQLRISDLTLFSNAFRLAASGTSKLDGQQLDIDAVLQSGGGFQQVVTQSVAQQSVAKTVPQVAAIAEFNELIRNRSIFLHIGGSTSRPVIQAKPGESFARAFLQNLGRSSFGTPLARE